MEIRTEQTRMELHIKAPALYDTESLVYLFAREGEIIHAIPVGKLTFIKGMGDCRIQIGNTEVGQSPYAISDMKGIMIENQDQTRFISQWDEEETKVENIRIYSGKEKSQEDEQQANVQELQRESAVQTDAISTEEAQVVEQVAHMEPGIHEHTQEASLHTAEIPMPRIIHGNFPREETLAEHYGKVRTASVQDSWITSGDLEGVKIELKSIREMPKQYWQLGNNSFVLHGFFNYRYLVLGKRKVNEKEVMFLGVPGIYQNQERVMASIFGFPEFVLLEEKKPERFGLWCHPMDE